MNLHLIGELGKLAMDVAPTIVSGFLSPAAGVVLKLAGNALGMEKAEPDAILEALAGHPEAKQILATLESGYGTLIAPLLGNRKPSKLGISINIEWEPTNGAK
jgi:hypothetical protein